MRRFNCPSCGESLWFRMLPFVGMVAGQFRFACRHCGTALTYTAPQPLIAGPRERLPKARLRVVAGNLTGIVLLSIISTVLGRAYAYAALGAVVLALLAGYLFSTAPAYKIAEPENRPDATDL